MPIQLPSISAESVKAKKRITSLTKLVEAINAHNPNETLVSYVQEKVDVLPSLQSDEGALRKKIRSILSDVVRYCIREHKLIPKRYYTSLWMGIGMSAFGVPIGVAFGVAMENMGLMGIGIALGLPIGLAIGAGMDKKAAEEGRQLDFEQSL